MQNMLFFAQKTFKLQTGWCKFLKSFKFQWSTIHFLFSTSVYPQEEGTSKYFFYTYWQTVVDHGRPWKITGRP